MAGYRYKIRQKLRFISRRRPDQMYLFMGFYFVTTLSSIDTLKRPARIKRLLDAPRWDLVVFDEAHHLDDATYDLVTVEGTRRTRFTLSREAATHQDNLQLMGLDHPLVQEELGRWRSVPPEDVGIAVSGDVDEPVLLSLWMVEASAGKCERRVVVQPIAVKQDGTRIPAVERLCEKFLQASPATPIFRTEQRSDLFTHAVEPTLQRELKHKGAANGDGSYSAELIGYIEIIGREV